MWTYYFKIKGIPSNADFVQIMNLSRKILHFSTDLSEIEKNGKGVLVTILVGSRYHIYCLLS